jgi:ATP-dependent exoDNAse (exonuclease V) beta subunit
LDFEHVYVVQMGAAPRPWGSTATEVARSDDGLELRVLGRGTPGWGAAQHKNQRREAAELVRLLYVAMTRAKARLVLSADWSEKHRPGPLANRMVELIDHRRETEVIDELVTREQGRGPRADHELGQWVLPVFRAGLLAAPDVEETPPVAVDLDARAEMRHRLRQARTTAGRRMDRPFAGGVSAASHAFLDHDTIDDVAADEDRGPGRTVAMAVGTAVHRLLEEIDLDGDLVEQLNAGAEALTAQLIAELADDEAREARRRLADVVDGLAGGVCLDRLRALGANQVMARELAMILPTEADHGPVGCITGFADLVYRDPRTDELVVADYKTDAVDDDESVARRTAIYEPQITTYARGLQEALSLASPPRAELWFLHADRIVVV